MFSSNTNLSLLKSWKHPNQWIVFQPFPSIIHCSHFTDANTKTHPFVHTLINVFPRSEIIVSGRPYFTTEQDVLINSIFWELSYVPIKVPTIKPPTLSLLRKRKALHLPSLPSKLFLSKESKYWLNVSQTWEIEIYIRKEKKEAFTNENFSSCSSVFITGLFLHWP